MERDIVTSSKRRRRTHAPDISEDHTRRCHGAPLGLRPTPTSLDRWVARVQECVELHCPFLAEKIESATPHKATLMPRLTALLTDAVTRPGDAGTLLFGLTPWLTMLDRPEARAWYQANHRTIKAAAPCEPYAACPACVAENPCPLDVTYELIIRRALDYRLDNGQPASLLDDDASKDLYEGDSSRKIDTWPRMGKPEMAAHMIWIVAREARAKGSGKYTQLLAKAVERDLHKADPHLALEVAQHWSANPDRDADIADLVAQVLAKATTNPGFHELELWFSGPYKRRVEARTPAAPRQRVADPKREPALTELRPTDVRHDYRYQVYRRPAETPSEPAEPASAS